MKEYKAQEKIEFTAQYGTAEITVCLKIEENPNWDDVFELLDRVKELTINGVMIGRDKELKLEVK